MYTVQAPLTLMLVKWVKKYPKYVNAFENLVLGNPLGITKWYGGNKVLLKKIT